MKSVIVRDLDEGESFLPSLVEAIKENSTVYWKRLSIEYLPRKRYAIRRVEFTFYTD